MPELAPVTMATCPASGLGLADNLHLQVRVLKETAIKNHAVIGDCGSAALVATDGSVNWLCLPRFDSPSVFAAILDAERGGDFSVRPTQTFRVERRYLPDTAVLETIFHTTDGVVRLIDAMPVVGEEERHLALRPARELLRTVECIEGSVEIEVICTPRPNYGRSPARFRTRKNMGLYCETRRQLLALRSELSFVVSDDGGTANCRTRLFRGDRVHVSLTATHGEPAVVAPLGDAAQARLDRTVRWWQQWAGRCDYEGPYRSHVVRSAITLKLMSYAPSGAVVAAPTTSLPEEPGGVRNWDYRFCWLRDASLTLQALFDLGYRREAEAYVSWLLHTTRAMRRAPRVLYDVYGEHDHKEIELRSLRGYRGAQPVRIGNDASRQLQLDNYGEVVDAVYEFVLRGGRLDRQTTRLLVTLGENVCRSWRQPDQGIWEIRAQPGHHVHSKVMCWIALDRLIRLHDANLISVPVARFQEQRDAIREAVEQRGFNEKLQSYTTLFDGNDVDASLLLLARYGYVPANSPRMRSTCELIESRLASDGLLRRYASRDDGLPPGEGAFGIASFWAAETLARQRRTEQAQRRFELLLEFANDVSLYAEEIELKDGSPLGNFPQAFTHVGLIDAALMLSECQGEPGLRAPHKKKVATTETV